MTALRGEVDLPLAQELAQQAGAGLAAVAAVRGAVRADEDLFELHALGAEGIEDELVRLLEGRASDALAVPRPSWLVTMTSR